MPTISLADQHEEHLLFYLDPAPQAARPVILLHGLGSSAGSWAYQSAALQAAGFRPLAVDLPGFGHSTYGGRAWSIAHMARLIDAWCEQLNLNSVTVAGISMGGTVALRLALDFPQRVERLVLVNTFACLRPQSGGEWLYLLKRFVKGQIKGVEAQALDVAWRIFPRPEQETMRQELLAEIRQADPQVYRAAMRALGTLDLRSRLPEWQKPTLVVTGEADTTVSPVAQRDMAQRIGHARQVVIREAGHAVIVDQPEAFNRCLLEFLE